MDGDGAEVRDWKILSEMDEQKDESFMHFIRGGSGLESFALLKSFLNGRTFNYGLLAYVIYRINVPNSVLFRVSACKDL